MFIALNTLAETKAAIFHRTWYASGACPSSLIDEVHVALTKNSLCEYASTWGVRVKLQKNILVEVRFAPSNKIPFCNNMQIAIHISSA